MVGTMNTLDWYPWYWKNWRLSEARETMNGVERGIYRELLDYCWSDGSIPDDVAAIARLTKHDEATIQAAWATVGKWFIRGADGRLYNAQMTEVRAKQEARYHGLQKRGKKGAKKRWNATAIAEPKPLQVERKKEVLSELDATRPRLTGGGPVADVVHGIVGRITPTGTDDGF